MIKAKFKTNQKTKKNYKKRKGLDFKEVEKTLKEAYYYLKYNQDELIIIIENIRLLSLNEIFAALQVRPYEIFKYKKLCHELIKKILKEKSNLPIFKDEKIEITYYRQASRYFDHDSLIPSFKFFLDGIVKEGIIQDDNPNIVNSIKGIQNIKSKQTKSIIGIKINKLKDLKNTEKANKDIYCLWGMKKEIKNLKEDIIEDF